MATYYEKVNPHFRKGYYIPSIPCNGITRYLMRLCRKPAPETPTTIRTEIEIPGLNSASPPTKILITAPKNAPESTPVILHIHGGGLLIGNFRQDQADRDYWAEEFGATVISAHYRLAPEHPAPAAIDDCFAAWQWIIDNAEERKFDLDSLVVSGYSAGGGLAAALVQRIHDSRGPQPIFQCLKYPMLDDRTVVSTDAKAPFWLWTPHSNRLGWTSYLGVEPGSQHVPPYSVAARRDDLSGLPPAWIGVGDQDMFYDEDKTYAERLRACGVQVELEILPGGWHAAEGIFPDTPPAVTFVNSQREALRRALAK